MFVNLAYLLDKPTGTASYALNLLPYLEALSPTYFAASLIDSLSELSPNEAEFAKPLSAQKDSRIVIVPANMTAKAGAVGHLRRLGWTQFQLPKLIKKLDCSSAQKSLNRPVHSNSGQPLLFTPIPEAPLSLFNRLSFGHSRLRSVVTFHDLIPLRFPKDFGAIRFYVRYYVPQVLAQAEKVICNSEATARDAADFYQIPARKLVPIPLAYDANHFRPTRDRPDVLATAGLSGRPYFLTLGRQAPYKNIGRVIESLSQVPACDLVIAGPHDPRYTPALEQLAEEKGVRSRVKFISYVPYAQLPALLSHAIALVFPSLWEGFGLPVLEAMACATPVITSNIASLPEVAGDAAYLINPYSLSEMVCAMRAIASDTSARQQLSQAGLQRVKAFSWQKTGAQTRQVLEPLI